MTAPRTLHWQTGPTRVTLPPTSVRAHLVVTGVLADDEKPPNSGDLVTVLDQEWIVLEYRLHGTPQSAPRWLLSLVRPESVP